MYDATKWTHLHQEEMCLMSSDGGAVRQLLADETDRWVLSDDFATIREMFVEAEKEMESIGDDLAEWRARALAAEQHTEDVRAEHSDDLKELRAELEARDE